MEENITQDPAQIIQSQSPMEVPPKPAKPWLKIVLLAVLGLVLAGGLFFAGMQIGKQPATRNRQHATRIIPSLTPTQPPVATSTPTFPLVETTPPSDETSGWKTYTNLKYNYQFRYPNDFKIVEESTDKVYVSNNLPPDPNCIGPCVNRC